MPELFEPTDEQRRAVKAFSGYGAPQDGIAAHLGIDAKTLRKHFRQELDRGAFEATAKVAQTLFHLATVEKNVASAIFWLKTRGGWREKTSLEVAGKDGTPGPLTGITVTFVRPGDNLDGEDRSPAVAPGVIGPGVHGSPPADDRRWVANTPRPPNRVPDISRP